MFSTVFLFVFTEICSPLVNSCEHFRLICCVDLLLELPGLKRSNRKLSALQTPSAAGLSIRYRIEGKTSIHMCRRPAGGVSLLLGDGGLAGPSIAGRFIRIGGQMGPQPVLTDNPVLHAGMPTRSTVTPQLTRLHCTFLFPLQVTHRGLTDGLVPVVGVFKQFGDGIQSEAVYPLVQPELEDFLTTEPIDPYVTVMAGQRSY